MITAEARQILEQRLRGRAHEPDLVRHVLSEAQRMINIARDSAKGSVTLITEPLRQVYDITNLAPEKALVRSVLVNNRDLLPMADWRDLTRTHRDWFHRTGPELETFATIGRDLLVLHPGTFVSYETEIVYTKLTDNLHHDTVELEIADDEVPLMIDLAETLLLLRERRTSAVSLLLDHLTTELGLKRE